MTAMTRAELRAATRALERAMDTAARERGNVNQRLALAWLAAPVRLRPEALPEAIRGRFLRLHERICAWPPGDPGRNYLPHCKALYPEEAADLLADLVDFKNAVRLLAEEHDA